jgi:glutamine synthetase
VDLQTRELLGGRGEQLQGRVAPPGRARVHAGAARGDQLVERVRRARPVLGDYFVTSFLIYKRNEIERFERFVTDWEFREYAYHL